MGKRIDSRRSEFDVLVIGSGIAGLFAALKAAKFARVCLVTKGQLSDTNTWLAQGGIAAAIGEDDSPEEHLADTLVAGAGACNPEAVAILVEEGPRCIQELLELGALFDCDGEQLALTREGAHHKSRVLHCGGDATGRLIQQTLQEQLLSCPGLTVREHIFVSDLLVQDGAVCGARTLNGEILYADTVILATGGLGQVFSRTTNPAVATGDGLAMAYRAGARMADLEFVQFHPTVFQGQSERETFLISEAVRGEGAVLRNKQGKRFMDSYHPLAELGPRDVVARAILAQMKKQSGFPVWLDITHQGRAFLQKRFPTIYEKARQQGLDLAKDWLPISPAAHYAMGGIATGLNGETSLPGLFACGEVACSGVHGANRLASNSLLEGLVFADRAVRVIEKNGKPFSVGLSTIREKYIGIGRLAEAEKIRLQIRKRMFEDAGLIRDGQALTSLQAELEGLAEQLPAGGTHQRLWETVNLLTVAKLIVSGALWRRESRGGHYRSDYPSPDQAYRRNLVAAKEDELRAPIAV
ncbi:MAG: L-aspartate oxidase [Dethiobacter sp.]